MTDRQHHGRTVHKVPSLLGVLSVLAIVLFVISFVPQARKLVVTGDVTGISGASSVLGVVYAGYWTLYAFAVRDAVQIATYIPVLVLLIVTWVLVRRAQAVGWAGDVLVLALAAAVAAVTVTLLGPSAIGYAAAALGTTRLIPQLWTMLTNGVGSGVSAGAFYLTTASASTWCLYGLLGNYPPVVAGAVPALILALVGMHCLRRPAAAPPVVAVKVEVLAAEREQPESAAPAFCAVEPTGDAPVELAPA